MEVRDASRILVVDDNALNAVLVSTLLSPAFEVDAAANGEQARAAVASFEPDLILMDLQLPDVDGLTLARQLRARGRRRLVPIIALTAHAAADVADAVRAAGCDGLITKPLDPATFPQTLRSYLAGARGA